MNMLNINFDKYLYEINKAISEVFGEYYGDLIEERVSRTRFIYYTSLYSINSYYDNLCNTKKRELFLEFFTKFGIDTSSFKDKKISERFPNDLSDKAYELFGFFPFDFNEFSGIKSFLPNADPNNEVVKRKRIALLNYLRNSKDITMDTYESFLSTDEYQSLVEKIKEYLSFYSTLKVRYDIYLTSISSYKEYIDEEEDRKKKILSEGKIKLLADIRKFFPSSIEEFVKNSNQSLDPLSSIFSKDDLASKFYIEYFSREDEDALQTDDSKKNLIKEMRLVYFKSLGIECDFLNPKDYDRIMALPNIEELVPSQDVLEELKHFRELRYEEALFEFFTKNKEFEGYFDWLPRNERIIDALYNRIKDNIVCVTRGSDDYGFLRFLFFSLKPNTIGKVDYMFLHELIHAIESMVIDDTHFCGFDNIDDDSPRSSVNPKYRKYERLNETITDILAIEVRERLIEKGIYIAEDEREWIRDVDDFNTHSIVKNMIRPLLNDYREVIIHSRLSQDMETLFDVIGKENFEEINYLVNKVDNFLSNGLLRKLNERLEDDPMVIEYYDCLERLNRVYERINKLNGISIK